MNYGGKVINDIEAMLNLFLTVCSEKTTMKQLSLMVKDHNTWHKAHSLFESIRIKTLKTEKSKDKELEVQYLFEEICAKTLYNLTHAKAPFDPDSPYWIVPNAINLARIKGIPDEEIIEIIMRNN